MGKRLALVAFEVGDGPWTYTKGNECGIQVSGMLEGEMLWLVTRSQDSTEIWNEVPVGVSPTFPSGSVAYRFHKKVPEGTVASRTSVEVLLNG